MKNQLAFFIFLLTASVGCGGGSSGTGAPGSFVGKVLTGSVVDENSTPVDGAKLTIVESGENTTTNSAGEFVLSSVVEGDINLLVDVGDTSSTVPVMTGDSTRTELKITVNRRTGLVDANNLSITAKIVGKCDFAFENNAIIRQANSLPNKTSCPIRVSVKRSGLGVSGIAFKLEHRKCNPKSNWRLQLEGLTGLDGTGQESFSFSTEPESCDYRIVVAYDLAGVNEVVFPIITFQRQAEGTVITEGSSLFED